jgi:hypothetical protein
MNSSIWKKASDKIVISAIFFSAAAIVSTLSLIKKLSYTPVDVTAYLSMDITAMIALIISFAFFRPNISKLMTEEHIEANIWNLKKIRTGYTFVITASLITYILIMVKQPVPSLIPIFFVFYGYRKMSKGYKSLSKSFFVPYNSIQGYKKLKTSTTLFAFAGFFMYYTFFIISIIPIDFIDNSTTVGAALQFFNIFPALILVMLMFATILAFILAVIASFKLINGWKIVKSGGFLRPDEF